LHLLIGLPLNAWLPKAAVRPAAAQRDAAPPAQAAAPPSQAGRATALLALVFAATWFISTAMATHLPRLLEHAGVGLTA
ncbi:hypothetical protein NSP19_24770, partial [Salmonella enterica]|nr:hypothetical protein [Salmonella enterica]